MTSIEQLQKISHPWSIDMWSLGAMICEILTGVPNWLSYKCRVVSRNGSSVLKQTGLFAAKSQDFEKIIQK